MFKHFDGSGTGIRSLLDQYVYLNRLEDSLDFPYIDKQCEILGTADFEKENRDLCKKVFWINDILAEEGTERAVWLLPGTEKTSLASAVLLGVPGCPDDFQ